MVVITRKLVDCGSDLTAMQHSLSVWDVKLYYTIPYHSLSIVFGCCHPESLSSS